MAKIPAEKIFYVELSECVKPVPPLGSGSPYDEWHAQGKFNNGDRFTWSICARLVPYTGRDAGRHPSAKAEHGVARVDEVLRTILSTGFNGNFPISLFSANDILLSLNLSGPIMFEFFEALTMERGDEDIPQIYSDAAAKSLKHLKSLF